MLKEQINNIKAQHLKIKKYNIRKKNLKKSCQYCDIQFSVRHEFEVHVEKLLNKG